MPYNPELDKELAKREIDIDGKIYEVTIRSYNDADPKVAISQKDSRYPVRRMAPHVFVAVAEAVRDMMKEIPEKTVEGEPPPMDDAAPPPEED